MNDQPSGADLAQLYIDHQDAVAERDKLRLAVGHVVLLIDLAKAVIAMREAETKRDGGRASAVITEYQAAKSVAYRLVTQWETARRGQ